MQNYGTMELWFTMETLWFYGRNDGIMGKNYGTIPKTTIYERKIHCSLPKTMKLWFIIEKKTTVIYQENWSFATNI